MFTSLSPVEDMSPSEFRRVFSDVSLAADVAFETIATMGIDRDEAFRLPVCFKASDLMLRSLVDSGYDARQEVVIKEGLGQHWYVVLNVILDSGEDDEVIVDPTWQQLLPKDVPQTERDLPRVLIGTRREIMKEARSYGVTDALVSVWEAREFGMSAEEQRLNDRAAEVAADLAAEQGAWDSFMVA